MRPILCIAGPTASGKSRWAVELARRNKGEIINADALQVYADLRCLSARPTKAEMGGIAHHMFGHVDGAVRYSTGQWLRDVQPIILDVLARGKMPILVGGTGLYFKALTDGFADIPHPEPSATAEAQRILDVQGIAALRSQAERLDPQAAGRVLGDDPQRLLRIVSVAMGTAKPLSAWQSRSRSVLPHGVWHGAVLLPERQTVYERINARFESMFDSEAVDEVKAILARQLSSDLPVMKAIGVPQIAQFLRGELPRDEAISLAQRDTRRFAKRQMTFFRGQMPDWPQVTPAQRHEIWQNVSDKTA